MSLLFYAAAAENPAPAAIPDMQYYLTEAWDAAGIPGDEFSAGDVELSTVVNLSADEVAYIWTEYALAAVNKIYIRGMDSGGIDTGEAPSGSTIEIGVGQGVDSDDGITACKLANGNIVVSWRNVNFDLGFVIVAPSLNGGAREFTEVKSWTLMYAGGWSPAAALLNNGNFVVAWDNYDNDPYTGIFGIFDQSGNTVVSGVEFYSNSDAYASSVAVLTSDKFVITFNASNESEVSYVIYNENGTLDTGLTVVSKGNSNCDSTFRGTIALPDGGWVTTYSDNNNLYIKKYNSSNTVISDIEYDTGIDYNNTLTLTDSGHILVVWSDGVSSPYTLKLAVLDTDLNTVQAATDLFSGVTTNSFTKISIASFNSKGETYTSATPDRNLPERFCISTVPSSSAATGDTIFCGIQNIANTTWESVFAYKWDVDGSAPPAAAGPIGGTNGMDLDPWPAAGWPWTVNYRPLKIRFTFTGISTIDTITANDEGAQQIINASNVTSGQEITINWDTSLVDLNQNLSSMVLTFTGTISITNIEFEVAVE